jgi:coniferyl-aldehyde dehydrogenase
MTQGIEQLLQAQRAAFLAGGEVSLRTRIDRLDRALGLLVGHQAQICEAVTLDFGQRPAAVTQLLDVFPAVHALKFARRNRPRCHLAGRRAFHPG